MTVVVVVQVVVTTHVLTGAKGIVKVVASEPAQVFLYYSDRTIDTNGR